MSRSDYLSRYLSEDKRSKKSPKKSKALVHELLLLNIVVVEKPSINVSEDEEPEELAPIVVELKGTKGFKGFKRIDGKAEERKIIPEKVDLDTPEVTGKPEQGTIYRDASGRIIDIDYKRQQLKEDKEYNDKLKQYTEVTLTSDEISAAAVKSRARPSNYDDPMLVFNPVELYLDQYIYSKGVSPANRFQIQAGCFWDGIDRSNGFEVLVLRRQNEEKYQKMEGKINQGYDIEEE